MIKAQHAQCFPGDVKRMKGSKEIALDVTGRGQSATFTVIPILCTLIASTNILFLQPMSC